MQRLVITGEGGEIALEGVLDIRTVEGAKQSLRVPPTTIDLKKLEGLDTPGALFLCGLRDKAKLTGVRADHQALLDLVCSLKLTPLPAVPQVPRWREMPTNLGRGAHNAISETRDVIAFVGRIASSFANLVFHPQRIRVASISRQITETGINALPIIGLLAAMIAIVIAYQGIVQLRPFGGEDFTINLVAVSVLREMGVLITAIMVAGRTGSAFTAEIGVMKAREEIDALKVMGMDPMEVLVMPRVIALVITLPLLTFFADVLALLGAAGISQVLLHVTPDQFFDRVRQAVDRHDLLVGLVKAPVFALVIAAVGCMHGLRVSGSAESVGHETTRSVVKAIFLVIVLDALFSIFFEKVGW